MNNQSRRQEGNQVGAEKTEAQRQAEQAQQKVSAAATEARVKAKEVAEQAKAETKSTVETQKQEAASQLHGVANALRQTSAQLREQDQGMFAEYSNRVADQVESVSNYLSERDVDDLIYDTESFARRQPELFLGGAFTLGLLAARFLKSSAPSGRRYGYDDQGMGRYPQRDMSYTYGGDYGYPTQPRSYPATTSTTVPRRND